MNLPTSKHRRDSQRTAFNFKSKLTAVAIAASLSPSLALALGEVASINTSTTAAPDYTYTASDTNTYNWGLGDNLLLDGFVYAGDTYNYAVEADNVVLRRTDVSTPCSVFTQNNGAAYNYFGSFPDGSTGTTGICDMASIVSGNIINTGALDVFSNTNGNDKNIERIDFLFDAGITAPLDPTLMARAGHVVTEKNGNNAVKIAAVTSVDGSGVPDGYGSLVTVSPSGGPTCGTDPCYGLVGTIQNFDFLHTADGTAANMVQGGQSSEDLGMSFVTLDDLGVAAGQKYYGFSYFGSDVDESAPGVDPVDISTFPTDTDRGGAGNADIYGGTAGYFIWGDLYDISGTVFEDTDASGLQNGVETGIADITVELYNDTNTNGTFDDGTDLQAGTVITDTNGAFTMPPVEDGTYFVKVDDADTDLPAGSTLPTAQDPITVTVLGANVTGQNTGVLTTPIAPVNAADENSTTTVGDVVDIDVLSNDTGTGLTITIDTPPSNGTATVVGSSVRYTPNAGFEGTDSFVYKITSSQGAKDTATVTITVADEPDNDNDGIPDAIDIDDDNDGITDAVETNSDFDGDGIPNSLDLDSDNDGIPDIEESGLNDSEKLANDSDFDATFDTAGAFGANGLLDAIETAADSGSPDYDNDGTADQPIDTDGDGKPNFLDIDSDGDGFKDVVEANYADADDNGRVDNFTDSNGDGWDNSAAAAYVAVSGVIADDDGDGKSDYCQCDCEGDAIHTGLEASGAGAFGWLMLPLIGGGLLRRRKQRSNIRRALPLAIATSLASASSMADTSPADRDFDQRFYLGAGFGLSMLEPDPECGCVKIDEDGDTAFQVMAGYDFSKHLTGELYYADLGEAELNRGDGSDLGNIGYQQYGLSLLGYFYNSRSSSNYTDGFDDEGYFRREGLSAFGRIGVGGMENDSDLNLIQDNSAHLHLGAGLEYGWNNGFAARAEFVSYDEDAKAFYVSLVKRFGSANPYAAPVIAAPIIKSVAKTKPKPALPPLDLPVVHFGHDLTNLDAQDKQKLDDLSNALKPRPNVKLEVRGHTDSDGSLQYNQDLSEGRAGAVKSYLESNGTDSNKLRPKGYSETQPVQSNNTPAGKQENRRVDFEILSQ